MLLTREIHCGVKFVFLYVSHEPLLLDDNHFVWKIWWQNYDRNLYTFHNDFDISSRYAWFWEITRIFVMQGQKSKMAYLLHFVCHHEPLSWYHFISQQLEQVRKYMQNQVYHFRYKSGFILHWVSWTILAPIMFSASVNFTDFNCPWGTKCIMTIKCKGNVWPNFLSCTLGSHHLWVIHILQKLRLWVWIGLDNGSQRNPNLQVIGPADIDSISGLSLNCEGSKHKKFWFALLFHLKWEIWLCSNMTWVLRTKGLGES